MAKTGSRGIIYAVLWILLQYQGSLASNARIDILPSQSQQTKAVGKNVLLTCNAEADDPQLLGELKWLDPLGRVIERQRPNSRIYTEQMPKSLALMIPMLAESDAGRYTCTTTYANSEVISKSITIEPIYAISWVDAPEEQFPILHKDYKIRCSVTARPAPQVDWLHHGEMIKNNQHFVIENDGLTIKKPVATDDGIYICRAIVASTGELAERVIRVEVHTPPQIEGLPPSRTVTEGSVENIPCKATGKPPPTYSWIKLSNMKNLSLADRFSVDQITGVLTINTVRPEDQGEYKCVASNKASTVEKKILINVLIKPKILEFRNLSVPIKSEVTMQCRATGNPLPTISFRKLSNTRSYVPGVQPTENRIRMTTTYSKGDNEAVADLIIGPLNRFDDGLYECIAQNDGGQALKNGHLTVQFPPTFERMYDRREDSWSWLRHPVNLSCVAESIPNATITWMLNGRPIEGDRNIRKYGSGPESIIEVIPESIDYYGVYNCTAANPLGTSFFPINLRQATPPGEILDAIPKVTTATTIAFDLIGPTHNGGRPIIAYVVQYKKDFESSATTPLSKRWPTDSPYILENLEPEAPYVFQFAALNDVGLGAWSKQFPVRMPRRSAPEQPRIINTNFIDGYVPSPYTDRVEVRWNIPADNGDPIIKYVIRYCPVQRDINGLWRPLSGTCTTLDLKTFDQASKELNQLTSDTYYRIELVAYNNIGASVPGEVIMKTARGNDLHVTAAENLALLSSGVIIGIIVASLFVLLLLVDLCCFCTNRAGLLYLLCEMRRGKPKNEDDPKLGREQKEPLDDMKTATVINYEAIPMLDEKSKMETMVNYDLKNGARTTPFIGKDSAV